MVSTNQKDPHSCKKGEDIMKRAAFHLEIFCLILALLSMLGAAPPISPSSGEHSNQKTVRVSTGLNGAQTTQHSEHPSISADGRYVVYDSGADNLVAGDTNNASDVFIYDRHNGRNALVSLNSKGIQGDEGSSDGVISANGLFVVFQSTAKNFVPGVTPYINVFVRDLRKGITTRITNAIGGGDSNGASFSWSISGNGRFVVFQSEASNLVAQDDNQNWDIFLYDRQLGKMKLASIASDGTQSNGLSSAAVVSDNGRWVAFRSEANNLVPGDTNGAADIFVHDFKTGTTQRVSIATDGSQANSGSDSPSMSADGCYIVFESSASNLVRRDTNNFDDIFLHDLKTGKTSRVNVSKSGSQANGNSLSPSISPDGGYVAFTSGANDLVSGDINNVADIFVKSLETGEIRLVSRASDGSQGSGLPTDAHVSNDGRWITFASTDTRLVPNDTNGVSDIFLVESKK
jgi:Tol biopolymer transport system component